MLFAEDDAPALKSWIVKRIEKTSDADADVLADYVVALLRTDDDPKSVRELCEREIPDFLNEDPKGFLDDVFRAVQQRAFNPDASTAPATAPVTSQVPSNIPTNGSHATGPENNSRKRGYDDFNVNNSPQQAQDAGRLTKQQRRQARRAGRDSDFHSGGPQGPMAALPPFDPNNPMDGFLAMQAMGLLPPLDQNGLLAMSNGHMPPMFAPPFQSQRGKKHGRRRGRCREFDTKGFCSRGNTCVYDHGNEEAFMPTDPEAGDDSNNVSFYLGNSTHLPSSLDQGFSGNRGRGNTRRGRGGKKGSSRAPFSAEGPVHDRTKTAIVVESIPEDFCSDEAVREFFSQFGNIQDVTMHTHRRLAIVKYDSWEAANTAYKSPKAIFDNRFVKVFWHKEVDKVHDASHPSAPDSSGGNGDSSSKPAEPELDPEEFAKAQEEAQKKFKEREAKKAEVEAQRQALEQKQQDLLAKHLEATEQLQARLSGKNGTASAGSNGGNADEPATETEQLRAKLAALESEAKILGIDPDGIDESTAGTDYSASYPRGGYRGRGRGRGSRGRGRGVFRGGAGLLGDRHAAYAQYSLDNRPRRIAIKGADFSIPETDEKLRHFFLKMGEFDSVDTSTTEAQVSFRDRKTAEHAFHSLNGKELNGVEGTLEVSWLANIPVNGTGAARAAAVRAQQSNGDDEMQQEPSDHEGSEEGEIEEDEPDSGRTAEVQREIDMDYDAW